MYFYKKAQLVIALFYNLNLFPAVFEILLGSKLNILI